MAYKEAGRSSAMSRMARSDWLRTTFLGLLVIAAFTLGTRHGAAARWLAEGIPGGSLGSMEGGSSVKQALESIAGHGPHPGTSIGICLGFTSRTKSGKAKQAVLGLKGQSPLFLDLVPSLCKTRSPGYTYSLWIGYDHDDPLLSIPEVPELSAEELSSLVPGCKMDVHFIKVNYSGNPTWAQNDAVLEAYNAGVDYFYRVNDDSVMVSAGWTEKFIMALAAMDPPYVGVVGPHHNRGNLKILTYDFTSRRHVDIFGFHYPREFRSWWGDEWITLVYEPNNMKKLADVKLDHKIEPMRYEIGENKAKNGQLQHEVDTGKETIRKWIEANIITSKHAS